MQYSLLRAISALLPNRPHFSSSARLLEMASETYPLSTVSKAVRPYMIPR